MGEATNHHVFAATTPNIGTTTIAIRHALLLAKRRERRVVFVCLNLKSSHAHTYFGLQPSITFDQLLPDIQARCLTDERLEEALLQPVRTIPNLRLLCGNMQRECAEMVHTSDVAYLLNRIAMQADDIVIDVSAYVDNSATLYALTQPWTKYCVTTNAVHHFAHDFRAGIGRLQKMYRLPIEFDQVYVRTSRIVAGPYSNQQIGKVMGVHRVVTSPNIEGLDEALQRGRYIEAISDQREAA